MFGNTPCENFYFLREGVLQGRWGVLQAAKADPVKAHIKAALVGSSVSIPISEGRLATG